MARDDVAELYQELVNSEFSIMQRGEHSLASVYKIVKANYLELCDDDFLCRENCAHGNNSPEWQHAVRRALDELKRRDSTEVVKGQRGYWIFIGDQFSPISTDFEGPENIEPQRTLTTSYRIIRDTKITRVLKALHSNLCQICGETIPLPNGQKYSEAHHIKPLGNPHDGPDIPSNILILCPNHHAMCDYGSIKIDASKIRRHPDHEIGVEFIEYHNEFIAPNPASS